MPPPLVLLCSEADLEELLRETVLGREAVELRRADSLEDARTRGRDDAPSVVLVHRELSWAESLVTGLRQDPETRGLSIAILAPDDFDPRDIGLLQAGANSVLRLPPDPDWDDRLQRLIDVPIRREARFPIAFEVEARSGIHTAAATAVNLSVRGMLLESSFPLAIGDDIDLRFRLPQAPDEPVVGTAQVVRVAGKNRYGIAFYGLEGTGSQVVRHFVEEVSDSFSDSVEDSSD